jgi:hypothetical protein
MTGQIRHSSGFFHNSCYSLYDIRMLISDVMLFPDIFVQIVEFYFETTFTNDSTTDSFPLT